jgi:hypothetical protein
VRLTDWLTDWLTDLISDRLLRLAGRRQVAAKRLCWTLLYGTQPAHVKVALVAALSCLSRLLNCVFWTLPCACCSLRLIALDGYTFNVRVGSLNHRLPLDGVSHCLGPAGTDAAANPLDLRLRCIKVSRLSDDEMCWVWGMLSFWGTTLVVPMTGGHVCVIKLQVFLRFPFGW